MVSKYPDINPHHYLLSGRQTQRDSHTGIISTSAGPTGPKPIVSCSRAKGIKILFHSPLLKVPTISFWGGLKTSNMVQIFNPAIEPGEIEGLWKWWTLRLITLFNKLVNCLAGKNNGQWIRVEFTLPLQTGSVHNNQVIHIHTHYLFCTFSSLVIEHSPL